MPLLALWKSNPDAIGQLNIEQVVSNARDGILRDGSECSSEFREYLRQIPASKIAAYIDNCLKSSFNRSGIVLQDLINELARRLDYEVTNGRYQGTTRDIGFDGLWRAPEGHVIVAEVKTTDAYRIALDTVANYREKLTKAGDIGEPSSILVVVGRQDTGELEAQVRGSRHAWDVRLISVEALTKLVQLKENSEGPDTGKKIRSLLAPMEYTRLDAMVDVMFTTAADVEAAAVEATEIQPDEPDGQHTLPNRVSVQPGTWQFTDSQILQEKRDQIILAFGRRENVTLVRKSRALYWSADRGVRVACSISKRYLGKNQNPYWYAYHPAWDDFLSEADRGYFVLGCMDLAVAFAIPRAVLHPLLPHLNTTIRDGVPYWHIHLAGGADALRMLVPRQTSDLHLNPYAVSIGQFEGFREGN